MRNLRIAVALGLLALSAVAAGAAPDDVLTPKKPVVVPERKLEVPFEFKTETDMKFRGSDGAVPSALTPVPHERLRPSFFGVGVSHPLETGK